MKKPQCKHEVQASFFAVLLKDPGLIATFLTEAEPFKEDSVSYTPGYVPTNCFSNTKAFMSAEIGFRLGTLDPKHRQWLQPFIIFNSVNGEPDLYDHFVRELVKVLLVQYYDYGFEDQKGRVVFPVDTTYAPIISKILFNLRIDNSIHRVNPFLDRKTSLNLMESFILLESIARN